MTAAQVSVVIKVPKKLQGKVIGRAGATLKDIESDYPGVDVVVPGRDSDSEDVIVKGPADAVKHAERRILDICGMLKDNSGAARDKARKLFDEADELFKKAKAANSKEERDELYKQAHAKKDEAHAANKEAAKAIFRSKNSGYGNDQMDLHGLYVKEAMDLVKDRLDLVDKDLRSGGLPSLTIITGAGHHSDNNKAKIKPQVIDLLRERGYPFVEEEGQLIISFTDASGQAPPQVSAPVQQPTTTPQDSSHKPQQQDQNQQDQQEEKPSTFMGLFCSCLLSLATLLVKTSSSTTKNNRARGTQSKPQQSNSQGQTTEKPQTYAQAAQGTNVQQN
mmetsp:Transcript_15808/g.18450  ORF Transcript_15808/g.18450 Transcript_15808/m.18450 type:complete len:334 (+) Transcript_15808:80-1081(+)